MEENETQRSFNRLPSIHVAIVGSREVGPTTPIRSLGIENAIGAASVAAAMSERNNAAVVLESQRYDVFIDRHASHVALIEGVPTELEPGNTFDMKSHNDPTSISSRMAPRPSQLKNM